MKSLTSLVLLLSAIGLSPVYAQDAGCPDHTGGFGPFDYTDPAQRAQNLHIVESHHFTPQVENLVQGATGTLGGDLDYTIRAFPNHHRALDALSKLTVRLKMQRPPGVTCSIDGYFERAIRFKADDGMLRMIYGLHFYRWKKIDKAKEQFDMAGKLSPNDANVAYNLGLIYADLHEWDKASAFAQTAYGAGFELPGLKNKLVKAGKWKEPPPKPAEPADSIKKDNALPADAQTTPAKTSDVVPSEVKQ